VRPAHSVIAAPPAAPAKTEAAIDQSNLIGSAPTPTLRCVDSSIVANLDDPPRFVQLVANPLRWRLLRELIRSDRAVWELTERLDAPQNLISYHLRQLRDGGLVQARRSAADGRDTYYAIDLASCEQQLRAAGGALHPALIPTGGPPTPSNARAGRRRVLFLCTGNSARSQMAEALLEHTSGGDVDPASAGSHPKPLHPNAIRVMRTRGIDISGNRAKHLDEFVSQRFDLVITLCDRVREVCPEFLSHPTLVHWSMPDPAQAGPTDRASYPAFERTAAELDTRIRFLVPLLTQRSTSTKTRRSSHVKR
jgi:protein-tyrosine-phosphatase/DNA-binding transcriptional ArsR family regulator